MRLHLKMQQFYSNGKLLITAEYVVLDGAVALALPTKFGQYLTVLDSTDKVIFWKSFDHDKSCWFETEITFNSVENKSNAVSDQGIESTLLDILQVAHNLNPNVLLNSDGFEVTTQLTFPRNWGLGTSSTLINNIAQWFKIDAFELLKNSFGGSGYDIACAQNKMPVLYQLQRNKPIVKPISFHPPFTNCIYFVYLNQKQSSKSAIKNYRKNDTDKHLTLSEIDLLTQIICTTSSYAIFEKAIQNHENAMHLLLNQPTVKEQFFSDFEGTIKSLGAWGGDFVMVLSTKNPSNYFKLKGFDTILNYSEMIL